MSPSERLVGREAVLAAAGAVLQDTMAGTGQFLMISGEAGIGKTAVLAALVRQAETHCLVLPGFCWEGDGAPPYWPWSQVLRASGLSLPELGDAGWLLQSTSRPAEPMSAGAAADARFRVFEAVSQSLNELADDRPVVVVLDDLHWADEPSLRLLGFLAHALAMSRVLLLGAYRDTEASTQLLQVATAAQQVRLSGLGRADVTEMVQTIAGTPPSSQVGSELFQRTGGNPFFVRELTRLLIAQGTWHEQTNIPAGVAEVLGRRLARLSTACVRMLEWAAVTGRDIDIGLLARSGATTDAVEAVGLLDEARRAGVITGSRDEPRFVHDLYREAILDVMSPSTRADLNLSIARALQERPGNAARVASHLLAAGPMAQPQAAAYSIRAAREATARLGHEDACAHYLRALSIAETTTDPVGEPSQDRSEILLELAAAHDRAGEPELARQRYLAAADASRRCGDGVTLARAALGVQSLGHRSGAQSTETVDLLNDAARRLEEAEGNVALRSRVLAALARAVRHGLRGLPEADVIEIAQHSVELATESGDPHALAIAKLALHDSLWTPGTAAQRLPVITEMLDAATSSGDSDLVAEAHLLRAGALLELGDPAGRDELLTYITLADALGHARGRWADGPHSPSWPDEPRNQPASASRHSSSGLPSPSRTPSGASTPLVCRWSRSACASPRKRWTPPIRSGRCFRC